MSANRDFVRLEAQLRQSLICRMFDRVVDSWTAASRSSRIGAELRAAVLRFTSIAVVPRVRAAAAFVAAFAFGEVILQRVVPSQVRPALPIAWWILVAAASTSAALCAETLTRAWPASRVRRWCLRA